MSAKSEILEILSDYVEVPVDQIDTTEGFKFSTGLDSFALLSFVGAIEDHFDIKIQNEDLMSFKTLDDIIAYIDNKR